MKKPLIVCALALTLFAGIMRPSYGILDKTRFVAHLGIAYFAFHHWVWKPYKAGSFATGAPHRTKDIIKGGVALLFAVHEVKVADDIAHKSSSPLLHKLVAPLDNLSAGFSNLGTNLKGGHFNPQDVEQMNTNVNGFNAQSTAAGAAIKDVPVAIPGAG